MNTVNPVPNAGAADVAAQDPPKADAADAPKKYERKTPLPKTAIERSPEKRKRAEELGLIPKSPAKK